MRLSILSPTTPPTGKGWGYVGICSAFARELWPQGWGVGIMLVNQDYGVVGAGNGLAKCLGENRKSSRCEDSCDRRRSRQNSCL